MGFAIRPIGFVPMTRRAWAVLGCLLVVLAALTILVWLSSFIAPTAIVPSRLRAFAKYWAPDSQNLSAVLQIISILIGLIGIAMVFIPRLVLRPFGIRLDPSGAFVARLFGATNIALSDALNDGQAGGPDALQGLGNAVFYYSFVQAVVVVWAVIRRVANPLALCVVFLDVAFIATIWLQGWAR